MKAKKHILFCLLFLNLSVFAQLVKYSNEFLNIGVGARALGMSNACIATVNDVTSGYWNPAGLLGVQSNIQLGLMHSEYFAGIAKYDYGAFATKIDSVSALGGSVVRFGVDNIPNTTELIDANGNVNYDRITSFSAVDYGFIASYARKLKIPGLRVGANAKVIRRTVGDFGGAWGFGLDLGAHYTYKNWLLGAMIRDVTTTFNAWNFTLTDQVKDVYVKTNNEIPENSIEITVPKILLGAARKWLFWKDRISLLSELNLDITTDGKRNVLIKTSAISIDPHIGLEGGYNNLIFLRFGLGNIQQVSEIGGGSSTSFQPNMGLGVRIKNITIDYALTNIANQGVGLYSNVFSLRFDINKRVN